MIYIYIEYLYSKKRCMSNIGVFRMKNKLDYNLMYWKLRKRGVKILENKML